MASKMLMGDMPELMENILKQLNNEIYSLYSCALVNRHWCKMSIPILWQDPFSVKRSSLFIPIYFSSLDEGEKLVIMECLKEFGIKMEFSKPLFDYARFLKILDIYQLGIKVYEWMYLKLNRLNFNDFDSRATSLITLPIKLFIESGAILHEFGLCNSEFLKFELEIFHSLEQNVQFYSRLQHLSLFIISNFFIENIAKLLRVLAKNTTKIIALRLVFHSECESKSIYTLFPALIHFIKSQEQLRKFILDGDECHAEFYGIISALESQKDTLQEVILDGCDFSAEFEILNNCKNLETLRILNCDTELLKILDYNISTLEISYYQIDVPIIVQILEKIGILLQRLKIETEIVIWKEPLLLEALKSFCPNIIYLYIKDIRLSTQLLELIGSLEKLQFLSLGYAYHTPEEEREIRVMQFAKILPTSLQYLDIALGIPDTLLDSFIDILLDHCNTPLKKLLISGGSLNSEKNTKALIRYRTRIRTLNYVGIVYYYCVGYNIRNELEKYVTLIPYEHIVVNC
ncbi:hypothetical protein F8M41_025500 [Gigaspora margarita]|uniref:F-box domain-containing protein n=1 Tax=Gigaspora margarita TaxID=4874 RepID=A0A8H3XJ79_GIGMA|nr:hypothetical protein F8M41_025500 [Gigaspora margarita]